MSLFLSFHFFVFSGCTDDHNFVTQTVGVGQNVTLTCTRQRSSNERSPLHWIRLVSGKSPELLGGTHTLYYDGVSKTPHITAKQGPGTFILQIHETQLSDTGFYYCIKVNRFDLEFMNIRFFLLLDYKFICSVLSNSEKKTCPEQQDRMFWFRTGSDESHPRLIYADGNNQDECETNPEAQSPQKCIYSFSKTVTSSDAGTYYCAVATCGQILFGNGTKLDNEVNSQGNYVVFLCSGGDKYICTDEESLVYSAPTFINRKATKTGRRKTTPTEEESIYTDVKIHG
uniref:Ig-like domain-containing protein n=1 Tax=Amphiprion ocellaris TaxID=80972 RepID=A0A3Q1CV63_AMPOC